MKKYFFIPVLLFIFSCKHYNRNQSNWQISSSSIENGELLAKKYCQGCHSFPEPSLLDVNSWETGVLPHMGPRLGILNFNFVQYPSIHMNRDVPQEYYPAKPLLTPEEWQDLMNFYIATAPDSMPPQHRPFPIINDLSIFEISSPPKTGSNPTTCFLHVDTSRLPHSILQGDISGKSLVRFDQSLEPVDSIHWTGPVIDIDFNKGSFIITNIGQLNPNNAKLGKLGTVILNENGKMMLDTTININSLQRPVQSIRFDLNGDGLPDELICEFGNLTGALSWYENMNNNHYNRHVLRPVPGAIKAYVMDYNQDGLPDLFVLFAQGEEGIFLFTNRGHGQFDEKEILRFPPVYGSSYFEMDDFNQDGYPDILYTCGDNADFSKVLKPYHGVNIYLNDKHWNFTQKYFFPIDGCYKAMARDFDGDGDLDLAVISFFPDFSKQPEEGFVYLENTGDFIFKPHSIAAAQHGRWLTMDVGDLDGDGKPDIVLGNFSVNPEFIKSTIPLKTAPSFLYLKNVARE